MMMRVMSSTPSPAVAALDWAHTYFGHFIIIFWCSFLEAHDFLKEAQKSKNLIVILFIVPWGHPKGVSQTLGPTMCFHLFLVEWVTFIWVV